MSQMPHGGDDALRRLRLIDRVCDLFEAAWKTGQAPRVEDFLSTTPEADRPALLPELVVLEVFHRRRRGEDARPEEYRARFPALDPAWLADLLGSSPPTDFPPTLAADRGRGAATHDTTNWAGGETVVAGVAGPRGQPFGDYELLEAIGHGGMGIVYRAWHRPTRRVVALKVIRPDRLEALSDGQRREWMDRFRKEAQAAARVDHPQVVTVYDSGEVGGRPFYSMRYVDGRTLAELLRDGPLPDRRAADWLEQVARAVHHIHARGVLHRDLKPRNILIDRQDRPHVADFGVAKGQDGSGLSLPSGPVMGTPSYMSPEQAKRAAGLTPERDAPSDVYSLGATFYEMLTGRPPFQSADAVETLRQVREDDPVPPRRLNPSVGRDLELICMKCLAKEPLRRYASAEQLADELQRHLRGEPLRHTRPVGRLERLGLWCRRNPALAMARGIAALAILGLIAVSLWFGIHSTLAARKLTGALEGSRDANEKAVAFALGNALTLCESGRAPEGLLWMAHTLEVAAQAEAPALEQTVRRQLAFHRHQFCPLQAVCEYDQKISAAAISPDGQVLLIGGAGGTARLLRASTGEPIGDPLNHRDPVNAVAFSPDGKRVATASGDPGARRFSREPGARLWDAGTGKLLHTLKHDRAVLTVAFSSDSKKLLTGGWDRCARLWDANTGEEIGEPFQHAARVIATGFSPDGKTLVTAFVDGTGLKETQKVRLWEVATRRLLYESSRADRALAVVVRPDGKALWAARGPEGVQMWEIDGHATRPEAAEKAVGPRWEQQDSVQTGAFSPDGRLFLTGGGDGYSRLWDLETGRPLGAPVVNPGAVTVTAFGPRGETFLTGCDAASIRLWRRAPGEPATIRLPPPHSMTYTATYSPDGNTILTASLTSGTKPGQQAVSTLQRWDVHTRAPVGPPVVVPGLSRAVAFHPAGAPVLVGGCEADLRTARRWAQLWDLTTRRPVGRLLTDDGGVITSVAWSPDGGQVVTGDSRGEVRLWDAATGGLLAGPLRHGDMVNGVAFSPDGRTVVTGSRDQTARLWEPSTGRALLLPHDDPVRAVAFHPAGHIVLTGSGEAASKRGTARCWDARTGRPVGHLLRHQGAVLAVACSPDGATILTGSADTTARLWDAATGLPLGPRLPHLSAVRTVAFHPQGTSLVTATEGPHVALWPTPTPLPQGVEQVRLGVETLTGMELNLDGGLQARALGRGAWQQRRQELRDQGSRPPP